MPPARLDGTMPDADEPEYPYIPPAVLDFGSVRELTKGSSGNGSADANSQYYWA
ncbi:lasso RiPP family leader peptide-containing protein [Nonomuraea sp. CA-143628]|uniref:lasso RiPP family leader peptide-containing protein n=1 Tax=Nonomuraea sp. CA-143628 TaxID=3239997 RepID=UPI003D8BA9B0